MMFSINHGIVSAIACGHQTLCLSESLTVIFQCFQPWKLMPNNFKDLKNYLHLTVLLPSPLYYQCLSCKSILTTWFYFLFPGTKVAVGQYPVSLVNIKINESIVQLLCCKLLITHFWVWLWHVMTHSLFQIGHIHQYWWCEVLPIFCNIWYSSVLLRMKHQIGLGGTHCRPHSSFQEPLSDHHW